MSSELPLKIYEPRRKVTLISITKEIALDFWRGRELAWQIFIRDLKSSYKGSFLGVFWLFIPPLATAGIWIFLNKQKVIQINDAPMDYPAFSLCGTIIWSLFSESLLKPMQRYKTAMVLMSKLNFPREALFLASFYDMLFSFLLKLIVLIPMLLIFGYGIGIDFLLSIPVIFLLIIMALSVGLLLSPVSLLYSDVNKAITIVLPFAMYLTPVIYPLRKSHAIWQSLNPVTPFLERARSLMGGYAFEMGPQLLLWTIVSFVILIVSVIIMRIALPIIVERSGS